MTTTSHETHDARPRWAEPLDGPAWRRKALVVAGFVGFVVATYAWPSTPMSGIVLCPFRAVTGLDCPGCGMTRSCTHTMHGDVWSALELHPLGPIVVVSFALVAAWRLAEVVKGRRLVWPWLSKTTVRRRISAAYMGALLFVITFGGLRLALEIAGILTPV